MLRNGGSTELAEKLLRSIKERAKEKLPYWGSHKLYLRDLTVPKETLLEMDERAEVEKWEHVEELRLWMKHALDLTVDIVSKDIAKALFISAFLSVYFVTVSFKHTSFDICSGVFILRIRKRLPSRNPSLSMPPKVGGSRFLSLSISSSSLRRCSSCHKIDCFRP